MSIFIGSMNFPSYILDCCSASSTSYTSCSFQTPLAHALIVENSSSVILAFRGTKEPIDFLTDAEFKMTELDGLMVHDGFLTAWKTIKQTILDWSKENKKPLYITGHSLGGAMANFAGWELSKASIPFVQCVTFGEPRSGDKRWANDCDLKFGTKKVRFINNVDIVPRVPGVIVGYRHTKNYMCLSETGRPYPNPPLSFRIYLDLKAVLYDLKNRRFGLLKDHAIDLYKVRLK